MRMGGAARNRESLAEIVGKIMKEHSPDDQRDNDPVEDFHPSDEKIFFTASGAMDPARQKINS